MARTVKGARDDIKQALIGLSTELPVSFSALADIAALGGQLGIGKSGIIDFTKTVAMLTATTNLTAEAAGTALGRFQALLDVPSSEFENLASAILRVGVNSVATESQIVTIATRIAGISKVAGLAYPDVIALAGALASVGVQPYAAQGTVIRLFTQIGQAADAGGAKLDTFAKIAGVSSDEFAKAYGTKKFGPILEDLILGLGDVDRNGGSASKALAELGINGSTDIKTLTQLAAASDTVKRAFIDAALGARDNTTLLNQFGKIADTTASRIKILGNTFQAFLNALGSGSGGPINYVVAQLTDFLKTLTDIAKNPVGAWAVGIATAFAVLSGVLLLLAAGAARGAASLIAMIQALRGVNEQAGASLGLLGALTTELTLIGPAGATAAKGLNAVVSAGKLLGKGLLIGLIAEGIVHAGAATMDWLNGLTGATIQANDLGKALSKSNFKDIDQLFGKKGSFQLFGGLGNIKNLTNPITSLLADITNTDFGKTVNLFSGGLLDAQGIGKTRENLNQLDTALSKMGKNGGALEAAAAFDHLKGSLQAQGATTAEILTQLPKYNAFLKEQAKAAAEVDKSNRLLTSGQVEQIDIVKTLTTLTGLNSKEQDKFGASYAKSVGSLTGFNEIVKQVQASQQAAADAQAKLTGKDASKFYDGQSVSLDQFTKQLQTNNDAQQTWAANLIRLSNEAGTGAANEFIQAGYSAVNSSILQQLVDATPEQRDAYIAAQQEAANLSSQATAQALLASGSIVTAAGDVIGQDTANKLAEGLRLGLPVEQLMHDLNLRFQGNPITPAVNTAPAQGAIDQFYNQNNGKVLHWTVATNAAGPRFTGITGGANGGYFDGMNFNNGFSKGGYTGAGPKYSVAGVVHRGEYVVPKQYVNQNTGRPNLDALGKQLRGYAGGGYVTPAPSSTAGISPRQMSAGGAPINVTLLLDGQVLTTVVNANNTQSGLRGAN